MADVDGLSAIRFWLFDFPQLADHRPDAVDAIDSDATTDRFAQFDEVDVVLKIAAVAEEICDGALSSSPRPTSASQAWAALRGFLRGHGLSVEEGDDDADFETLEGRYSILRALLCHALSDRCERQREYVGQIMAIGRRDVQEEIMRILQENAQGSDVEDNAETADYSVFMDASVASTAASFDCESDIEHAGLSNDVKRDRSEAFGDDDVESDSPQGKKPHHEEQDEETEDDATVEETADANSSAQDQSAEVRELQATIAKLQQQLSESQQKEAALTVKADEDQSNHRAEMLQVESKHLKTTRDLEEKYTSEISEQKRELETLRDFEQSAKQAKEENARLRDELDVLECSKEKLSYTEEQLRKCREKIEVIGDAHDALEREEKAHAAAVDKCVKLENELAQLKPLKRQLEEYRMRATDAEVALSECREDLRRTKEKSTGLEGANHALQRGAHIQQAEADKLQQRLQEEGGKSGDGGLAVGVGMSELNPELMEELKTLRSEHARLKEFESKREVDAVQRLEESCDDAKRLSERYKEHFFSTKSQLEDTQKQLSESLAREATLKQEVADWSMKCKQLGEEMKEERVKSHKAALEAERAFQEEKRSLLDKGREELQALDENMTLKIEAERKMHKEKMDRADAQRVEIENNLNAQLANLREQSSKTLRSAKEMAEKRIAELEQSKQAEVERLTKDKADAIETLTTKGKGMLRESKQKNKDLQKQIKEKYEVEIRSKDEELARVKDHLVDYEKKALDKISKRDRQIKALEARNSDSMRANGELEDRVKKAERKSKELAGDNDRLRRQLGSRFGPGGASQSQLDEMTSLCKSLRDENRRLKEANPDRLLLSRDMSGPASANDGPKETAALSKSALTQFREEYEEKIDEMEDEKRDLFMKCSAASAETQKAEKRAWELEEELTKVRSELTTAKLALQRFERRNDDFSAGLSASSKKRYETNGAPGEKENTPNARARGLPPSGVKRQDFTPQYSEPKPKKKTEQKSLMDLTSREAGAEGAAPECQQS